MTLISVGPVGSADAAAGTAVAIVFGRSVTDWFSCDVETARDESAAMGSASIGFAFPGSWMPGSGVVTPLLTLSTSAAPLVAGSSAPLGDWSAARLRAVRGADVTPVGSSFGVTCGVSRRPSASSSSARPEVTPPVGSLTSLSAPTTRSVSSSSDSVAGGIGWAPTLTAEARVLSGACGAVDVRALPRAEAPLGAATWSEPAEFDAASLCPPSVAAGSAAAMPAKPSVVPVHNPTMRTPAPTLRETAPSMLPSRDGRVAARLSLGGGLTHCPWSR